MELTTELPALDLTTLYNNDFQYSFPKSELEKCIAGTSVGCTEPYTNEEFQRLCRDIQSLYDRIVPTMPSSTAQPEIILTAGGPGVGKTLLLRGYVDKLQYPYIDPDDVCLRNQVESYLEDIKSCNGSPQARRVLYEKWRAGSNAACHIILAHLIKERHPVCFGTTASSPFTYKLLDLLVQQGYKITFLHITSPSDVCWAALQERDKTFIQSTVEDVIEKAKLVPQRINDTFLKYATEIKFYYRDRFDTDAVLAATWIRNPHDADLKGSLSIVNNAAYEKIKKTHNGVVQELGTSELLWEKTVETSSIFLTENNS